MKFILEDRKFIILDKSQASHQSGVSSVCNNPQSQIAHTACSLLACSARLSRLHVARPHPLLTCRLDRMAPTSWSSMPSLMTGQLT